MGKSNVQGLRWDRIKEMRARLMLGFFDVPDIHHDLLVRSLDPLLDDLKELPVGEGDRYRDLVAEVVASSMEDIVDVPMMQKEVGIDGGRADLEIPVRIENLDNYPVWRSWQDRFAIRSMLVETKNLKTKAAHEDVNQLKGYLQGGNRGRLGMLVSRNGFTRSAQKTLSSIAKAGSYLILPFNNDELCSLSRLSKRGAKQTMEFLRRKELFLLQAA